MRVFMVDGERRVLEQPAAEAELSRAEVMNHQWLDLVKTAIVVCQLRNKWQRNPQANEDRHSEGEPSGG